MSLNLSEKYVLKFENQLSTLVQLCVKEEKVLINEIHLTYDKYYKRKFLQLLKHCENLMEERFHLSIQKFIEILKFIKEFKLYIWDRLHLVHWNEVPRIDMRLFSIVSNMEVVISLIVNIDKVGLTELDELIKTVDYGILLGSEIEYKRSNDIINELHEMKTSTFSNNPTIIELFSGLINESHYDCNILKDNNRMKILQQYSISIELSNNPSVQEFYTNFFSKNIPLLIKNSIQDFPALKKWNLEYFVNVAGDRIVPVELGNSYLEENSGSKLMPLKNYIRDFIIQRNETKGYLAQHQLLKQIPILQKDIYIPDYCSLLLEDDEEAIQNEEEFKSFDDQVLMNIWFGKGNVTPLHHDPYHNLLTQLKGYKYVRLYDPVESEKLYPMSGRMSNNSKVDILSPDIEKFPLFSSSTYKEVILSPGDMLFIPRWHWHFIMAIDEDLDRFSTFKFDSSNNIFLKTHNHQEEVDVHRGKIARRCVENLKDIGKIKDSKIAIEYKYLINHAPSGVYLMPELDNIRNFHGVIFLKAGLYRNGIFRFTIVLPPEYNDKNTYPQIRFFPPVFSPLINETTGEFDLKQHDTLNEWDPKKHYLVTALTLIKNIFYRKDYNGYSNFQNPRALKMFNEDKSKFYEEVKKYVNYSAEHIYDNYDSLLNIREILPEIPPSAEYDAFASEAKERNTIIFSEPQPIHEQNLKNVLKRIEQKNLSSKKMDSTNNSMTMKNMNDSRSFDNSNSSFMREFIPSSSPIHDKPESEIPQKENE